MGSLLEIFVHVDDFCQRPIASAFMEMTSILTIPPGIRHGIIGLTFSPGGGTFETCCFWDELCLVDYPPDLIGRDSQ